jgi:serine/threonine-protein kinase
MRQTSAPDDVAPGVLDPTRFMESLVRSELLTAAQLADLERNLQPQFADPLVMARSLVNRGWLTALQANRILTGRAASLRLGPYLMLEKIGQGGLGKIYKARHIQQNRIVAVKIFHPEHIVRGEGVRRLHRVMEALSRLEHTHLLKVYGLGQAGSTYFVVMDYVAGTDMGQWLMARGRQSIPIAVDWVRQAALGLHAAYEAGLVHGDLRPSHLLVPAKGNSGLKLIDVGLSAWALRLTEPASHDLLLDSANGWPDYTAPERLPDRSAGDIRSDIYSLGCILYALLTGRPPYADAPFEQKADYHAEGRYLPIEQARKDVPSGLAAVLRGMLAAHADGRYPTPGELARDLAPFTQDHTDHVDFSLDGLVGVQTSGVTMAAARLSAAEVSNVLPMAAGVRSMTQQGTVSSTRKQATWVDQIRPILVVVAAVVIGILAVGVARSFRHVETLPPATTTELNGRALSAEEAAAPIALTPGEHDLSIKNGDTVTTYRLRVGGP